MIGVLAGLLVVLAVGPVQLRSGEAIPAERVAGFNDQGVLVRPDFASGRVPDRRVVGWSEVEGIGADNAGWGEAERYRSLADDLHRAERRLARGDVPGAAGLLEPLAERYLAEQGPTSGAIASALAMCRLMRDDREGAVRAWLCWRAGPEGPARAWIDAGTGLMTALPPVWTERSARGFLAMIGEQSPGGDDAGLPRTLDVLYADAAHAAAGTVVDAETGTPAPRLLADPGVRLVWEAVRAQTDPDPADRASARDRLRQRVSSEAGSWRAAWARLALGASMIREDDRITADAGAAELIGVMLEDGDAAPGLADLAAALAAGHFESTGRPDHAAAVYTIQRTAPAAARGAGGTRPGETGAADEEIP